MEPKPLIAKKSRRAKIILVACVVLFIVFLPLIFAYANRPATVRAYFWAEQNLIAYWPSSWGKSAVEELAIHKVVGNLCRIGFLRPVRVQVEPGVSFLLDPRDLISVSILRGGEWQPEIWDALLPVLTEGAVFLDVGAHIGYFSIKASTRVGKTGHVVAFEPNPEILKLLQENVTVNKTANVTVEPIACTDREQTLTLWASASFNTGMSSLARDNADISYEEPPRPYNVRGRPIDDVVSELNLTKLTAIKIDVEGAELGVLRGAMKTLKRFHPKLVVEMEPRQLANFKTTPEDVVSLITGAGYKHGRPLTSAGTDWEWTE